MGNSLPMEESGAPSVPEQEIGAQSVPEQESGAQSGGRAGDWHDQCARGGWHNQCARGGWHNQCSRGGWRNQCARGGWCNSGQEVSSPEAVGSYAAHVGSPGTPPSIPSLGPGRYNPSPDVSPRDSPAADRVSAQPVVIADDDAEAWGTWRAPPSAAADGPAEQAGGVVPAEDRETKRPRRGLPSGSKVQLSAVPVPGEAENHLLRQVFMEEQQRRIQEAFSLGIRLQAAEDEPLPMLSHYYGRPSSAESMYDSLSYAMTDRGFLTRVSLGAGSRYVPGGSSGITGPSRLDRPEEFLEETPCLPPRLPSYPEPEQPRPPKLMIDAATITDNALDEWSAWLRSARQGRSLREWGILASDLVTAIQYLSEAHPEVPSVTKGGRWSNAGRAGRRKQQQQEYPSVLGMLAYLKEALRCVDCFDKAPTGYNSLLLGPAALVLERPASASPADEAESWKYIAATMAARVQRLLDKKRRKNQAVTEITAVYLQTAKSAPRPRPVVQSPTTPAEGGDSSGSDSSEISGVSGESRLEGEGVAEAIGVIRSCQDKGESLWTPGVVCRLFGTPELPHKVFPEAAKAMAEQAAAASKATAIDPTAAAASTDTAAGAAVVPPTPGTEPKSPHCLPSVIFRPGRLIEKTLMIEAADGSSVPVPPAIPKRHPLPQPPPAPSSQSSPTPNLGQTRAEREFVLPKPTPVGASSSEAQFEDYESVVEAARAAIESASQQL